MRRVNFFTISMVMITLHKFALPTQSDYVPFSLTTDQIQQIILLIGAKSDRKGGPGGRS